METILILGASNSSRSQMAEGFMRHILSENIKIESAGVKLASIVEQNAIDVMREIGIDISDQKPKLFRPEMMLGVTIPISMGTDVQDCCEIPLVWTEIKNWDLDDPSGTDITFYREIREKIIEKVCKLFDKKKIHYHYERKEETD